MRRRIVRVLGSPLVATGLLVFVGAWSAVASAIPQGDSSAESVVAWASAHPVVELVVGLLGLHHAFTSPVFVGCVLALAASTGLCSWARTKVAVKRARLLRQASGVTAAILADDHEFEITCAPGLTPDEVLSIAGETLEHLGVSTKTRDGLVSGVSARWTVWGSPIFHWALVTLIVLFLMGALQRSEGLMGLAVGETRTDAPTAYGTLKTGPLYDRDRVRRAIRLDAFEPSYVLGGMDRGPTPTVSVLDGEGNVVKTQRVYPNKPLRSGSLTIHDAEYGLAVRVSLRDATGSVLASQTLLVDFSEEESEGTRPAGFIPISKTDGTQRLRVYATVPLDSYQGELNRWLPVEPTARIVVTSDEGEPILERVLAPEEELALPVGAGLRLESVGPYSRLSVVDDWTIPFVYAAMILAIVGLTITLVARQQLVLVTVVSGPDSPRLVANLRLWRNAPVDVGEAKVQLGARLGVDREGELS